MPKLSKMIVFSILFLLPLVSEAQTRQVYLELNVTSREKIDILSKLISIDNVVGNTVYAYGTNKQLPKLDNMGYKYKILPNPGSLINPKMSGNVKALITTWDSYPTYDAYVTMMYKFAEDYPMLCSVTNIGNTVEGREILVAKLSNNINIEESEPEVFLTSSMHGDEIAGYVVLLREIYFLLTNYGTDQAVTNLLDSVEIHINPLANPDGTYRSGNSTVYNAIRYNANFVDLNRNFPDPESGQHPDGNDWQPETIAMMNFASAHSFVLSANFHGGAEVVNYPWDTWYTRHADDTWFIDVSRQYADLAQANSPSGYMTGFNNGITNGYDWYTISGGRQDYMNYWQGCREVTIELSDIKLLPENQLVNHWNYNREALLGYIGNSLYGISGLVTDAETQIPVDAVISIMARDNNNSEVFTDPDVGDYHRMIEAGTYTLMFTANGYIPQTISGVSVIDGNTTLNVQMVAQASLLPDITANGSNGPVNLNSGDNLSVSVQFSAGSSSGSNADWWVLANTPLGWYHYDILSSSWVPGQSVTYQASLSGLPPYEVLSMSGLPGGSYTFYFGVDMVMNGSIDLGELYYDSVEVNITMAKHLLVG